MGLEFPARPSPRLTEWGGVNRNLPAVGGGEAAPSTVTLGSPSLHTTSCRDGPCAYACMPHLTDVHASQPLRWAPSAPFLSVLCVPCPWQPWVGVAAGSPDPVTLSSPIPCCRLLGRVLLQWPHRFAPGWYVSRRPLSALTPRRPSLLSSIPVPAHNSEEKPT